MKRKFMDRFGNIKYLEIKPFEQKTPITSLYKDNKHYQRQYPKWVIKLNAWLSRRNADLLRYF